MKYFHCSRLCENRVTDFLHTVKWRTVVRATAGQSEDVRLEFNTILTVGAAYPVWGNTLQRQKKIPKRKDLAESSGSSQRSRKDKLQELQGMFSYSLQNRLGRTTHVIRMHTKRKGVSDLS